MKKTSITFLISLLGILFISPVLAASSYPEIAGITIGPGTTATQFVVYFFNLAIAVGAFIAGAVLLMAGIDYVSSRGEPAKLESAKSKIKNAFLGLTILLASFIILTTINPALTNIKIDKLTSIKTEVVIPEGSGVYLYDSPSYVSTIDPLRVIGTKTNFETDNFNRKVQSIKFVNPDNGDFKFGAVLFAKNVASDLGSGYDLRGNCSFAFNSIPDLGSALGQENNPPIGKNNLSSIIVFKTKDGSASVTLYNSIDCKKGTDEYEEQKDENAICKISSGKQFVNIKDACPNFKGNITSIETSGDVGILFKIVEKGVAGRCQYLESNNTKCINNVKHSYAFNPSRDKYEASVIPQSFIVFPLVK